VLENYACIGREIFRLEAARTCLLRCMQSLSAGDFAFIMKSGGIQAGFSICPPASARSHIRSGFDRNRRDAHAVDCSGSSRPLKRCPPSDLPSPQRWAATRLRRRSVQSGYHASGWDWDWTAAGNTFNRAIAAGAGWLGSFPYGLDFLTPRGHLEDALRELHQALRLDL